MTSGFDVIICGAGPAGCTAALALGSSGLKVALIEKERFPRDKICGDAVPAFVPKVLNTINPEYAIAFENLVIKNKVSKCRIISPDQHVMDLTFPEEGFVCRRMVFDSFLFELAGSLQNISLFQVSPVIDVSVSQENVLVTIGENIHLKAQIVIGCDGANSIIKRKLAGSGNNKSDFSFSVRTYFSNLKDTSDEILEFYFLRNLLPGYFWIFPLAGNLFNVGLGMPLKKASRGEINLAKELLNITKTVSGISYKFSNADMTSDIKGHLLPVSDQRNPISGDRFMLCGDAASLVNPVSGAGIGQAMQSGRYAGWQVLKCFDKNDFSAGFLKEYDLIVFEKIRKVTRRYKSIRKFVINSEWELNAVIKAGSSSKSFRKFIVNQLL